jgi:hypothetical protein
MIRRKKEERLGIGRLGPVLHAFLLRLLLLSVRLRVHRLNIHKGVCLRILLFYWKPIFPTVLV